MADFHAETSRTPAGAAVRLSGECDLAVREQMTEVLTAALRGAPVVEVDLAGVTFIDSSGLHGLVTAHHAAQRAGGRLQVTGATGRVAEVLQLTGIGDLLAPGGGRD